MLRTFDIDIPNSRKGTVARIHVANEHVFTVVNELRLKDHHNGVESSQHDRHTVP